MATEIYKFADDTWNAITELQYMDGATPRDITEVHYNDGGTWRQVFGSSVAAQTLAWSTATPTNTYFAIGSASGKASVTVDTSGNFSFSFFHFG